MLRDLVALLLLTAGVVALTYGAWLVYEPAGWLVAGLALVSLGTRLGTRPDREVVEE